MNTITSYDDFVRQLFQRSGDFSKDFAHAILGVVTETHELVNAVDSVNFLEEAGDLRFYVTAAGQVISDYVGVPITASVEMVERLKAPVGYSYSGMLSHNNELLDIAKRWVGYGKAPNDMLLVLSRIQLVEEVANQIASANFSHPGQAKVEAANVAKLSKRYPGLVFSQDSALNRNTDAERLAISAA